MGEKERWLVAAWPGMGQVATTAAVYLLSKLGMSQVTEFTARDLFELDSVDIHGGLLRATRLPRSRLFLWRNPSVEGLDVVVFLGEAQPPAGKLALCQRLLKEARHLDVSRVFTFSAMATTMEPKSPSRTFGVASDTLRLEELQRHGVSALPEGQITGLNGVALAAAAEAGLPAVGLLGELPAVAAQVTYPNAAASVLRVFAELAGIKLDLRELEEYGRATQGELVSLVEKIKGVMTEEPPAESAAEPVPPAAPQEKPLPQAEVQRIEELFQAAAKDRSKAFELKKELDRLGVFRRFEDRFLDLFEHRA